MPEKNTASIQNKDPRWLRRIRRGLGVARLSFNLLLVCAFIWILLGFIPAYRAEHETLSALSAASAHLAERRREEAGQAFHAVLARNPEELRAQLGLIEVEAASEEFSDALQRAHRLSTQLIVRAEAPLRARLSKVLIGVVSPSAQQIPPVEPYVRLIQWLPLEGKESILEEAGRRALDLNPDSPWGAVAIGRTLLHRNRPVEATDVIRHGLMHASEPQAELVLNWFLCEAYARTGNWAAAVEAIHRAIAIDPKDPNLHALRVTVEGFLARQQKRDQQPPGGPPATPDLPHDATHTSADPVNEN